MKEAYKSDLKLGEKYRDNTTGLEGTLISIHFYEHACERGTLRYVDNDKNVQEVSFDAPELVEVKTNRLAAVDRPGGPARAEGHRSTPSR